MRDAVLAGLKAEFGSVLKQQADLNHEMMRLPVETRCRRWMEYYTRLDELTKRQQRIEAAAEFLTAVRTDKLPQPDDRSLTFDVSVVALKLKRNRLAAGDRL